MSDASGPNKPGEPDGKPEAEKKSPEAELLKPEAQAKAQGRAGGVDAARKRPKVLDGKAEEVKPEAPKSAGAASSTGKAETKEKPEPAKPAASAGNGGGGTKTPPPHAASTPGSHLHLISGLVSGIAGAAAVVVIAWHFGIAEPAGDGDAAAAVDANKQAIADLSGKVEGLEGQLGREGGQQNVQSAIDQALAPIDSRLSGLEQEVAARGEGTGEGGGASAEAVDKLTERLDTLETQNADLKSTIAEASQAAVAAQNRVGEMQQQLPAAGLDDKVARLDALIGKLNAQLDKLTPQLQQMETRIAALEKKADDPDAAQRAALALALANLSRAIEGAGPFKTELETVASFLPNEEMPSALQEAAATGVPTRAALKDRFEPLIERIFDAERRAGDTTIWDRFAANAASLITVRRTGEISGDSTEAIVARMEEKLKEGDLAGAVAQGEGLKGAAADAASPWIQDAQKRLDAEKLVRELTARVTARLAELKG